MANRNMEQQANRAAIKYWMNQDPTVFDKAPDLLSAEWLQSINNAGSALVNLIRSNASDLIEFGAALAPAAVPTFLVTFTIPAGAAAADYDGTIIIPWAWKLVSAKERHQTLGTNGSAVTLMPTKVPSGTAKASGTAMLTAGFDLKGTIDTNQSGTLSATAADYTGAAGDGVGLVLTGTATAVDGVTVTLEIQRV